MLLCINQKEICPTVSCMHKKAHERCEHYRVPECPLTKMKAICIPIAQEAYQNPAIYSTSQDIAACIKPESPNRPELGAYDSTRLAVRLGVSVKAVVKHRAKIPGAFRVGRCWRFDRARVELALLKGNLF